MICLIFSCSCCRVLVTVSCSLSILALIKKKKKRKEMRSTSRNWGRIDDGTVWSLVNQSAEGNVIAQPAEDGWLWRHGSSCWRWPLWGRSVVTPGWFYTFFSVFSQQRRAMSKSLWSHGRVTGKGLILNEIIHGELMAIVSFGSLLVNDTVAVQYWKPFWANTFKHLNSLTNPTYLVI